MPRPTAPRPYDLDALAPYLDALAADRHGHGYGRPAVLAALVGRSVRAAHRILTAGALSEEEADRAAAAVGLHPGELWPDYWTRCPEDDDLDRADQLAAARIRHARYRARRAATIQPNT